jgi:hypothetical protein
MSNVIWVWVKINIGQSKTSNNNFGPTSMVEHQNPTTPEGVNIIMLMPLSIKIFLPHCATTTLGITLAQSMASRVGRS